MRKITLILALLLLKSFSLLAVDGINELDVKGQRQGHWVITGKLANKSNYGLDAKVEEGNYKDNLKIGVWTSYFPSGTKQSEFTYVNGRPNGHAVNYFENGKIEEEGTWVGQRWTGDYHRYYDTGVERQHFAYGATGVRDGAALYTNPNGTKQIEVTLKAGKEDGWKREYDANGVLIRETFFNNGVIDPSKTKEYKTSAAVAVAPEDPKKDKTPEAPPAAVTASSAGNWNGEGQYTLMKGGQVSQKGVFHAYKLVTGEARFYDNNGFCNLVKLYKDSKYIGDGPLPEEARK